MSLDFLLLSSMLLLKLLGLLSVLLLQLLFLRFGSVLLFGLLVLFNLLLLQLLMLLILLSGQLVLLLLIFLVRCRLAGGGRRVLVRLNFAGVVVSIGMCRVVNCWTRLIGRRCVLGALDVAARDAGLERACSKCWFWAATGPEWCSLLYVSSSAVGRVLTPPLPPL